MSIFNPECTGNYFRVHDIDPSECTGGNPYAFRICIKVPAAVDGAPTEGRLVEFDGLDMGDLQMMKGAIN